MSVDVRIPVTVLTGFLGSGKTTLLNRILSENHGQRIAVIENEFGEIGVDQELVINAEEEIFETNNGCICCTVRGDLIRILGSLAERRDRFDRIVIETTGLANPGPVAQTFFVDEAVRDQFALDGIVTLIDSHHFEQQLAESDEVRTQVAFADVIVLNKVDLVSEEQLASLENRVRSMNAMARIVRGNRKSRAAVAMEAVLGVGGFDLQRALEYQPKFLLPEYPFEWGGAFELAAGNYRINLQQGPDPTMKLVCTAVLAGEREEPGRAAERVFAWFSGDAQRAAPGTAVEPCARAWELDLEGGGSMHFDLCIAERGWYWLFTQHLPAEFDLKLITPEGVPLSASSECDFAPGHSHDDRVGSFALEAQQPLYPVRFQTWMSSVLKDHGTRLYRLKGFLNLSGTSERVVIQGVHMIVDTSSLGPWSEAQRRTQLVFIGRELDREVLAAGFRACQA